MAHPALCRRVFRFPDAASASRYAAARIANVIHSNPFSVLGLATGRSVMDCYAELPGLLLSAGTDVSRVTTVNMDEHLDSEFRPVDVSHALSYRGFMQEHLHGRVPFNRANIFFPEPEGDAPRGVGTLLPHYTELIRARGGIDFQLAGIGRKGHVAFNEANECSPTSPSRIVALAESTILANAPLGGGDRSQVPPFAATIGMLELLEMTRELWVLAFGVEKAEAIRDALEGPESSACPASWLRAPYHRNVTFVLDSAAAGLLSTVRTFPMAG